MKWLTVFFVFCFVHVFSQTGFQINNGQKKTTLSFKLINNLIFIPVFINGVECTFLLDSGVNETILFSLENKDINFNDVEKIKFNGLGENLDIHGLKSVNNVVTIGKNFEDPQHTIFIIQDESINFSSHIGIPVNGIMGYQFFRNHPIEINYINKKITIYHELCKVGKKLSRFEEFPVSIELNKPYINAKVEMTNQPEDSKLLIDLGNSDAVWLFPALIKDFVYNRPNIDDYLGRGFNGDIFGKRSRIHAIYLGNFKFEKPLTAMPDEFSIQHLKIVKDRKGSIGSDILRRFTVLFSYEDQKVYLKRNKHYHDPFLFNKSGLDIKHDGLSWEQDLVKIETKKKADNAIEVFNNTEKLQYKFVLKPQYSVAGCRKNSPCDEAGIKKEDQIISINDKKVSDMNLQKINDIFKGEEDQLIKMTLKREAKTLQFQFQLKDPIPYQENQNP